ncbi:MAG: UDP-N-acetylmuramate dehydrogenase [Clostridia bacterium]|nr:UDP-N-acetylmuramate dehydrogenase [Clostridia bacterium]
MKADYGKIIETLNKKGKPKIQGDFRLSHICTMGIGGKTDLLISPNSIAELTDTVRSLRQCGIPYKTVGAASNLIFSDDGFRGAVIRTVGLKGIFFDEGSVTCEAGVFLPVFCRAAASLGLGSLHGICGIPGTVGGALMTSAGAFGCNIYDRVTSCTVYRPKTDETETVPISASDFSYRASPFFDSDTVILSASFALPREDSAAILRKMHQVTEKRKATQPVGERSAGSYFKRPKNAPPAAFLIDRAGLKGYSIGGAAVSDKHAGFIINRGNATSSDILALADAVKRRVYQQFSVLLEEEAEYVEGSVEGTG